MKTNEMGDSAVLAEIGRRLQVHRLNLNLSQTDVAEKAGISRRALQNIERGQTCTLTLLVRTLRALGQLDALDGFLPEPSVSPIQLAKLKGRERKRAGKSRRVKGSRV